ncbi:alpha/beta hydrolase [Corallococcus macrosporus]|uniref:Esterase n=1 Tax=Corallococcus macrosporus DSM 14697 TaxID=1189310 RepID=A0A250JS70_9BACT|nr:alpha/beta hydrolase-fold protein [Corallococcus macrosporus]ATB46221.1 esterase [Corallococcus macrosporus DSM 14697]
MMRIHWLLAAALLTVSCASGPVPRAEPVTLQDTFQFDLGSAHTGRTHRIYVAVPKGPAPAAGHPVIYLLDGDAHFPTLERLMRALPRLAKGFGVPAATPIIVGLTYAGDAASSAQARGEDYTPPAPDVSNTGDRFSKKQGGADRFLDFVKQEVEPALAARLPLDGSRTALMGHSYGGLLVLHALFTRPTSFNTFVAGSPSIWWNDRYVLTEKKTFVERAAATPVKARVLLTVGGLEQTPRKSAGPRGMFAAQRRMVDNTRELAAELSAMGGDDFQVQYLEFPSDDHYGSWLPLLNRGLLYFTAPALLPGAD